MKQSAPRDLKVSKEKQSKKRGAPRDLKVPKEKQSKKRRAVKNLTESKTNDKGTVVSHVSI